jgi:hypothetical protein
MKHGADLFCSICWNNPEELAVQSGLLGNPSDIRPLTAGRADLPRR